MKKRQKQIIIYSIIALVILSIVAGIYFSSPTIISKTSTVDPNLGTVTQTLTTCNWLCKIFHPVQQAYFIAGTYKTGDTVTVVESLTIDATICANRGNLVKLQQVISKDGSIYSTLPAMYTANPTPTVFTACPGSYSYYKTTTFTPSAAGTYTIQTLVTRVKDVLPVSIACTGSTEQCNIAVTSAAPVCAQLGASCGYSSSAPSCCSGLTCQNFGCYSTQSPTGCVYNSQTISFNTNQCFGTTKYACGSNANIYSITTNSVDCGYVAPNPITVTCPDGSTAPTLAQCPAQNVCPQLAVQCTSDSNSCDTNCPAGSFSGAVDSCGWHSCTPTLNLTSCTTQQLSVTSPCANAVWQNYPTCSWSTSNCVNQLNNQLNNQTINPNPNPTSEIPLWQTILMWVIIGVIAIMIIIIIVKLIRRRR